MVVYQMVNSPDQTDQLLASNFSKKVTEVQALGARQADLAKALSIKGPERQKKEAPPVAAAPPAAAASAGAQSSAGGDAACYQAEMTRNQGAMQGMSARAEEAQKKGDNKTMMALADSVSQITTAAMRKCGMMK